MAWAKFVIKPRPWWLPALVLVAVPLFFIGGPDWVSPPLYRVGWSLGHILFFALLVIWLHNHWPLDGPGCWLALSLGVVALSVVIEVIQSQVGREPSWQDGLRNLIGAWLGLFWRLPGRPLVWLLRVFVSGLLLWQLYPLGQASLDVWHRWQQFPVLSDFESPRDLSSWKGDVRRVAEPVVQGRHSLAFSVGDPSGQQRFTGIELAPLMVDWRGYAWLTFSLYSKRALAMTLRINDGYHDLHTNRYDDRFNGRLYLEPGWNHIRIALEEVRTAPARRTMNMADIQRLLIFSSKVSEPQTLYLDNLRLE